MALTDSDSGLDPQHHNEKPSLDDDDTNDDTNDDETNANTPAATANPISRQTTTASEIDYVTGLTLYTVLGAVSLVSFLVLLDTSIITTAIPRITDEFHSLPDVGWYGSAYQLCNAALQPLTGKIYSSFNTKWAFLSFFLVFELGSLLCGVATSSTMMIIGRAVSGMGGSGLMNGSLTIIASCAPVHKRAPMTGVMMGISQLGSACGPLLGGAFTQYVSWRWCFYVNLPVGAVAAGLLLLARVPDQMAGSPKKPSAPEAFRTLHKRLDLVGFALFAPAAVMLLLALEYGGGGDFAWDSATVIGLFCGSAATFLVWGIWNSRRGEAALIPFGTVTQKLVWTSGVTMCLLFCTLIITSYYLPIYFQAVKGVSAMTSGVHFLPSILPQLVFSILSGFAMTKTGFVVPYALASTVMASTACGLISTLRPGSSTGKWVGYQILGGAGRGTGFQAPLVAVQTSIKPAEMPVALAFLIFLQFMSSSVFLTIANTLFNQTLISGLRTWAPDVDASSVIAAGATGFRDVVDASKLGGVLRAYADSLSYVFILAAGLGGLAFFTAWGMGWVDIRKVGPKKKKSDGAATEV